jgi:hypothetical protein
MVKSLWTWFVNVLIAVDVVVSVFIGGAQGETLSSTAYRKHRDGAFWGFMCPVIEFFFGKGHCLNAYVTDRNRTFPV